MPLYTPRVKISAVAPLKVGGTPSPGSYASELASAFDHAHALVETAGPTNLDIGAWLDLEMCRRVGGSIVGRQLEARRFTTGPVTTSSTSFADVGSQMNFALKAGSNFLVFWVVYYQTEDATTPIRLSTNFTGTVDVATRAGLLMATSPTAMSSGVAGGNDVSFAAGSAGPGPTDVVALVSGMFRVLTAGNLALRYRSGASSKSVTVQNGSHGFLVQV